MNDANPADEDAMVTDSMTPAARDEADAPPAPEVVGLQWEVTAEPNPFHRRLLVTDGPEPVVDLVLDPLVVQDLIASLAHVHAAQCAALGLPANPARSVPSPDPDEVEDEVAAMSAGDAVVAGEGGEDASSPSGHALSQTPVVGGGPMTLAWWWQHKLLAFLLLFAVVFAAVGACAGPS